MMARLFGVDRGTIRKNAKKYTADLNVVRSPGRDRLIEFPAYDTSNVINC
jgi:hypothetical protein